MIKRDRASVALPTALVGEKSKGGRERARAEKHFRKAGNGKKFRFRAYGDKSVKRALNHLFGGKCAYCESHYATTQPMDVEHFRPKSEVVDGNDATQPGYWWLAASWDNLLPSCIDCNRRRGQELVSQFGTRRTAMSGKECRFPLGDESRRAKAPGEEAREDPLLLHPCRGPDPSEHLFYCSEGVVIPVRVENKPSRYGQASIEIYGLNRVGLVNSRREILTYLHQRMFTIESICIAHSKAAASGDEELIALLGDLLWHEIGGLVDFAQEDRPYSLMAKQVITRFLDRLSGA